MAGCLPEYLPVIIAAVEAICEPRFNLYGVQATTGYVGPALLLNGPIRTALDVNCDAGVFGPGFRSNATIGRAIRLILISVGGGYPGDTDRSTFGWPGKYTMCFGENQEKSPWEPYHVEMGFRADERSWRGTALPRNKSKIICGSMHLCSFPKFRRVAKVTKVTRSCCESRPMLRRMGCSPLDDTGRHHDRRARRQAPALGVSADVDRSEYFVCDKADSAGERTVGVVQ
ncbi:MAG: hypothetical protein WD688_02735 [Candidatus Binatia bacterium]